MAQQTAEHGKGSWPFYGSDGQPRPEAATVLGGWQNGWQNGWRVSLRARPSALQEAAGRPVVSLGWHPDVPDVRDKTVLQDDAQDRLAAAGTKVKLKRTKKLPSRWENLTWCSPVEDQGALGSCTAQAVVGLAEFMQRRAGIRHVDGSRLFVYKVTRKLLGWTGDTGGYLRSAMKAVAAFGIPPEEHWPYVIEHFDDEPTAFLYSFAQSYQFLEYTRIDARGLSNEDLLNRIREVLASGLGVVFGFSVYSSLTSAADVPYPDQNDRLQGGHAVMAVGYDDDHQLPDGTSCPSLIIRNSWGRDWGVGGYGFLPYRYVTDGLARDFWTALKTEWIELEKFEKKKS